jgi:hypothetical protein
VIEFRQKPPGTRDTAEEKLVYLALDAAAVARPETAYSILAQGARQTEQYASGAKPSLLMFILPFWTGGGLIRLDADWVPVRALKKEEFPGFMVHMQPGNSFPQICVVSVIECAETDQVCTIVLKECASK